MKEEHFGESAAAATVGTVATILSGGWLAFVAAPAGALLKQQHVEQEEALEREIQHLRSSLKDSRQYTKQIDELDGLIRNYRNKSAQTEKGKDARTSDRVFGENGEAIGEGGIIRLRVFQTAYEISDKLDRKARRIGVGSVDDVVEHFTKSTPEIASQLHNLVNGYPTNQDIADIIQFTKFPGKNAGGHFSALRSFVNEDLVPNFGAYTEWATKIEEFSKLINPIDTKNPQAFYDMVSSSAILREMHKDPEAMERANERALTKAQRAIRQMPAIQNIKIEAPNLAFVYDERGGDHMGRLRRGLEQTERTTEIFDALAAELDAALRLVMEALTEVRGMHGDKDREVNLGVQKNQRLGEDYEFRKAEMQIRHDFAKKRDGKQTKVGLTASNIPIIGKRVIASFMRQTPSIVAASGTPETMAVAALGLAFELIGGNVLNIRGLSTKNLVADEFQELFKLHEDKYLGSLYNLRKGEAELAFFETTLRSLAGYMEHYEKALGKVGFERIMEASVKQEILHHAVHVSEGIDESARSSGLGGIDDLLRGFDGKLGISLRRLAYGHPNSNDMTWIIACANEMQDSANPHEQALHQFVENVVKKNIGYYFSLASRIDDLESVPTMNPEQSDRLPLLAVYSKYQNVERVMSVFFGGKEELGYNFEGLTRRYQFYMHRHGNWGYVSDDNVHDGVIDAVSHEKQVEAIDDAAWDKYQARVEFAANSNKAAPPPLDSIFVRISASEYLLPQFLYSGHAFENIGAAPEYPASVALVDELTRNFMERLNLPEAEALNEKIGYRFNALLAQSFFDFFRELGRAHSHIYEPFRTGLPEAQERGYYLDNLNIYRDKILQAGANEFPMFLKIYRQNLETELLALPKKEAAGLRKELERLGEIDTSNPLAASDITGESLQDARKRTLSKDHTGKYATGF